MRNSKLNLDDADLIQKYDQHDMLKLLVDFGKQCEDAVQLGRQVSGLPETQRVKKILFVGLGGSAIGANLVTSFLTERMKIPAQVTRDYTLPAWVDCETLVFATSYSGNTEETLSGAAQALKRGAVLVTASSGGKLKEFSQTHECAHFTVPSGFPPRAALGYAFFLPLILFMRANWADVSKEEIQETLELLKTLSTRYHPEKKEKENPAKQLARAASGHMVHIYGSSRLDAVSVRWRGQISENAKQLASHHLLPEMNHNEIVGWEHPNEVLKSACVFFLRDHGDHTQVQKRFKITRDIISKYAASVHEMNSQGKSELARVFSLVVLGDFMSFYLAILNQVDPTPVDRITFLKTTLAGIT
jgi:glucose/mannose-6-phosphate isomerase